MTTFRTIIIPQSIADQCRQIATTWAGGVDMFRTALYTGNTLTHYISTGHIGDDIAVLLDDPAAFAVATGIPTKQAAALRSQIYVSSREDVHSEIAELGLSLPEWEGP